MKVFAQSDEIGELGYNLAKVQFPEKCTGCKLCLLYCPDFAIAVEEEGAKEK
jgi:Pyruvate/2-oxoacid:ferredoxin oxidoreductase delta subunit